MNKIDDCVIEFTEKHYSITSWYEFVDKNDDHKTIGWLIAQTDSVVNFLVEKGYSLTSIRCGGIVSGHDCIVPFDKSYTNLNDFAKNTFNDFSVANAEIQGFEVDFSDTKSTLTKENLEIHFVIVSSYSIYSARLESSNKDILLLNKEILQSISDNTDFNIVKIEEHEG